MKEKQFFITKLKIFFLFDSIVYDFSSFIFKSWIVSIVNGAAYSIFL